MLNLDLTPVVVTSGLVSLAGISYFKLQKTHKRANIKKSFLYLKDLEDRIIEMNRYYPSESSRKIPSFVIDYFISLPEQEHLKNYT
ncbi:hypothetical protein MJH12_19940, partial [bacterium]|nr:hypothetical protein [bacterium]